MNDLEEILFGDLEELPKEGFKVTNIKEADWVKVRIKSAVDRINERTALAKEYKRKIDEWLKKENEKDERNIDFLTSLLEPWVREKVATQKNRSINILGCRMGFRKLPPKIEFKEGYDPVEEAKKAGIKVEIKEYVPAKNVKEYIKKTGKIPDFVNYIDDEERFYITFEEDKYDEIPGKSAGLERRDSLPRSPA